MLCVCVCLHGSAQMCLCVYVRACVPVRIGVGLVNGSSANGVIFIFLCVEFSFV